MYRETCLNVLARALGTRGLHSKVGLRIQSNVCAVSTRMSSTLLYVFDLLDLLDLLDV